MGLGSECSLHESVEDIDSITIFSAFKMLEDHDGSRSNGYPVIEGEGSDVLGSVNLLSLESKHEVSSTPSMTKKGVGLKKWKRIKRGDNRNADGSVGAGKMVKQDFLSPDANASDESRVCFGAKQKSEGSVSSTDAVVRSLDDFALLGDSGLVMEPSFAAGTDSESSEDRRSKSSTAASSKKSWVMSSGIVGFPSGRNLMRSSQHGLEVRNRVETSKKARRERVKIEKESSHSSMESDSRSSNVMFIQGAYHKRNGKRSERSGASDRVNGDKFYCRGRVFSDKLPGGSEGDYGATYNGKSNDHVVAESSRGCKEDGSENQYSLVESIFALQSVQEALEKEVLKFREVIHDASSDDSVRNLLPEFEDVSQKLQPTTLEQSQRDEDELEYLFKQKIEAEVEYLVFSSMSQRLRVDVVDQNLILERHKAVTNERSQMLEKLQDTENKAKMIEKQAEKLENSSKDIASSNDMLTVRYGIFKYTLCFFMQLVLLVVIIGVFMFQLLPYHVYDVPT